MSTDNRPDVFCFVVPLISRARASDWPTVSALLRRTVRSMLQQGRGETVRVILVCNDVPEGLPADERLHIESRDFPLPEKGRGMADKFRKVWVGLNIARKLGATHVMISDADDLLSRRFVPTILDDRSSQGWSIARGYLYDEQAQHLMIINQFDMVCGTSSAHRVGPEELPDHEDQPPKSHFLIANGHTRIRQYCQEHRQPHRQLQFLAGVYVAGSGVNDSGLRINSLNSKLWRLRRLLFTRSLSRARREEFGLYPLDTQASQSAR